MSRYLLLFFFFLIYICTHKLLPRFLKAKCCCIQNQSGNWGWRSFSFHFLYEYLKKKPTTGQCHDVGVGESIKCPERVESIEFKYMNPFKKSFSGSLLSILKNQVIFTQLVKKTFETLCDFNMTTPNYGHVKLRNYSVRLDIRLHRSRFQVLELLEFLDKPAGAGTTSGFFKSFKEFKTWKMRQNEATNEKLSRGNSFIPLISKIFLFLFEFFLLTCRNDRRLDVYVLLVF